MGAYQRCGMLFGRQASLAESGCGVAILAGWAIVRRVRCLVAASAVGLGRRADLVAVIAGYRAVGAIEGQRVPFHLDRLPRLRRAVALAASDCRLDVVGPQVAGIAVPLLGREVTGLVAVQAGGHGTVYPARYRVKAVARCSVAVAAVHVRRHAMLDLIVECLQPVLRKLIRHITVAGLADVVHALRGICDDPPVDRFLVLASRVAVMAGGAGQPAMAVVGRWRFDDQPFELIGLRSSMQQRLSVQVALPAGSVVQRRLLGDRRCLCLHPGGIGLDHRLHKKDDGHGAQH
jgi:hypothetical protein